MAPSVSPRGSVKECTRTHGFCEEQGQPFIQARPQERRAGRERSLPGRSVARGLQSLKERPPDVIVMDIRMPGMTGIEGLREILLAPAQRIEVVLVTCGKRHW